MKSALTPIMLAAALAAAQVHAGAVLAHESVSLTMSEVRAAFLGERQFAGNAKLVLADNAANQAEFLAKVLQTDERKYAARWLRQSFRKGLVPPTLMGSDAEVAAFVKSTPGAVGYVTKSVQGVKVIHGF